MTVPVGRITCSGLDSAWENAETSSPLLRLTREQRASLFAGRQPRIAFPASRPCPIDVGTEYRLSDRLSLTITGIRRSKSAKEWELQYTTSDFRPTWMRARLPRHSNTPDETVLDAVEIQRAALESGYTPSVRDALDPGAEAVPPEYEKVLLMRQRLRTAEHSRQRRDQAEAAVREQVRSFSRELRALALQMVRAGVDPNALFAELELELRERQHALRQEPS